MTRLAVTKKPAPDAEAPFIEKARAMAEIIAGKKAKDIQARDLRGLTLVADAFLLCTATSEPQMKAVVNALREDMKALGVSPLHIEGAHSDGWLLMDYGDVIVHIFRPKSREFYDLDGLWGDAPEIDLKLEE